VDDAPRRWGPGTTIRGVIDALAELAAAQGGPFTRAQALAAGYPPWEIRALRRREWADLCRGVYVERALLEAADERARHVLQAAARVLTSGLAPVVSRRSGALVHSLPLLGRPPREPELTRAPRSERDRSETSAVRVAPLPPEDVTEVNGIPVTSLARTACDVGRTRAFREGVVVADAVLRRQVPRNDLLAAVRRCRSWPGGVRGVQVAELADGRADGPLESITRVAYADQGLPAPETQVEVWSPDGVFLGLVDFLWRQQRVVGEADGLGKYDAPLALKKEKLREEGLRACGLEVVRHVWDDVWTPPAQARLAGRVRDAFAYAERRPAVAGVVFRTPPLTELLKPPWERSY
jgi:hypothetical protein